MKTQLYLISPPQIDDLELFMAELESALSVKKGLVGAFQLRLKKEGVTEPSKGRTTLPEEDDEIILSIAEKLKPICNSHEVAFIINDRPDLAVACGADGVHIGQEDGEVATARKIINSDMVIGATCHNSRHLAMEAAEQGADYIAFGAFYPTTSKTPQALEKWGTPTTEILEDWCNWTEIPCVAIGGITPENSIPLIKSGVDFIAVINAVWNHKSGAADAVKEFAKNIQKYGQA